MSDQIIAIELSQSLYERLHHLAQLTQRPLESLVVQTLDQNLPPLPDTLPEDMQTELAGLADVSNERLWAVLQTGLPEGVHRKYIKFVDKDRRGILDETEKIEYGNLFRQLNQHRLRRAYTAVLLKWRGFALPSVSELPDPI